MTTTKTPDPATVRPLPSPNPLLLRLLSLAAAALLSGIVLFYPRLIAEQPHEISHTALGLLMWGIAAGFVHGVGFVPRAALWRLVFHPFTGWLLMAFGAIRLLNP